MPAQPTYASFLVRVWCEDDRERGTPAAGWQGEVQHIQTSQRRAFSTLDELLNLLRQVTEEADTPSWMASK
jgi:hypothetical protein